MTREIKESDWKLFRQLHGIALERFSQRVLEEVRLVAIDAKDGYHGCYLKVYGLLRTRDETMVRAFNDPKRSMAIIQLTNIVEEGLLTDDKLKQFSAETREGGRIYRAYATSISACSGLADQ